MFSKSALISSQQLSKSKGASFRLIGEGEDIDLNSITTLKDTMGLVSKFVTNYNPQVFNTPFQGTDLKITMDGKFLVFGSMDGRIARFNRETQALDMDAYGDEHAILTIAFTPDDQYFFIAGEGKSIRKFSLDRFELVESFKGHSGAVLMILVMPDNSGLISAGADKTVRYWSFANSKKSSSTIVTHQDEVQSIDLTPDGQYLMTGSTDQNAFLFKNEGGNWVLQTTLVDESAIFVVKISNNLSFLVTGNQIGTIVVWEFGTWQQIRRFQDSDTIWCIEISLNEEFIVSGGMSHNIIIWDLVKDRESIVMTGHTMQIKSLVILKNQQEIISLSNDSKIMKWIIPAFEDRSVAQTRLPVVDIWFSNQNGLLYVHCDSTPGEDGGERELLAFNILNSSKVKEGKIIETQITHFSKSEDDTLFYVIYKEEETEDTCISSYDLNTMERKFIKNIGATAVTCFTVSLNHEYLFIGQIFKILTFFLQETDKSKELYNSQIYHIGTVERILCRSDNSFIISNDNAGIIKLIDVKLMADTNVRNDLTEILEFKKTGSMVSDMKLISQDILVVVSYDKVLIWNVDKASNIKIIDRIGYIKVNSSLDSNYIFLRTSERLEVWSAEDFSYKYFLQGDSISDANTQSFHISPDNKVLAFSRDTKIFISRSPTLTQKIFICGNSRARFDYFRYLSSIIDDSCENHVSGFDDWIIEPFHMNALHFYAYYNFDEFLTESLSKKAPFFCTAQKFSPLSIALELKFPNCTNAILRKLREVFIENPFIFISIENCLSQLNDSGYEKLHSLYDDLLSKSRSTNVPKFCSNKPSFPVVMVTDNYLPKKEDFESSVVFEEEGNSIVFLQSYIRIPIKSGTSESIDFIRSIEGCKNLRIFDSQFIQILLQVKWNQVKYVVYFQMAIYMVFLVLLSLYTVKYRNNSFLIAPFAFNCFFILYESAYMISGRSRYFADYWNYVDVIRVLSILLYAVLIWVDVYPDKDWFLAVVILISWTRGVAYFRSFKVTRYLINLLITACKDIAAFLLILLYSTISFALIFYSIASEDDKFFDYLTTFYDLNLGNSDTSAYDKFHWIFYVLVTILNPIIMINLLISILGDTYANVKENEVVNDAVELISLISEAELLMFWRRGLTDKHFIHVCDEFNLPITQASDSIKNKIKALKRRVLKMTDSMVDEEKLIKNIGNMLKVRNSAISDVIEKYENLKK